jgi:hypothetical protein
MKKLWSLLLVAILVLSTCVVASAEEVDFTNIPRNETLYWNGVQWGTPNNWNVLALSNTAWPVGDADRFLVYEALYMYNMLTNQNEPLLADGDLVWEDVYNAVVKIKDNIHFSDGTPMTAEDVAYTFNIANSAESQRWLILNEQQLSEFETSAVNNKKPEVASLLSQISNMLKVGHKEDVEGADSQLTTVISDLTTRANSATGISELIAINNEALSAALTFLSQVTVTDAAKPFTLTYLIKNPGVDTDTEGWSRSATVNYSCAEFYQTIFDFNQTLASMPVGTYKLQVQAFQRPGTSADSYTAYAAGTNNVNATVYAGAKSAKIAHIASDARVISIGGGTEAQVSGHYMPNDMEAASLYFKKKLYENEVYCSLSEAGDLKIGLKASEMGTSYWVVLDNFRLSYYGKLSEEQILGIDRPQTDTTPLRIFTLDGRQLSPDTQLRPGLYIINGRKVAVK